MKIIFIGSVEFSLSALRHLVLLDANIVGVCTLKISTFNSDHIDLKNYCDENEIPNIYANDINSVDTLEWIRKKSPDVIFCFGWSRLIKSELLVVPKLGVIGFHPAALPANRGRHPIIWALVLGLQKTASTFFFMDDGFDSGDILSQEEILIVKDDDARTLYNKITRIALNQISDFMPKLAKKTFLRVKQNQENANSWRKRNKFDGRIDWRMSAESIFNLVRGLTFPYPGAYFLLGDKEFRVWKASVISNQDLNIEPGKVLIKTGEVIVVKCGSDAISLLHTDPLLNIGIGEYLL